MLFLFINCNETDECTNSILQNHLFINFVLYAYIIRKNSILVNIIYS